MFLPQPRHCWNYRPATHHAEMLFFFFIIVCVYVCVHIVHVCVCHSTCVEVRGQLSGVSSSTMWVPEIKLRSKLSDLAASTFTCWAISPAPESAELSGGSSLIPAFMNQGQADLWIQDQPGLLNEWQAGLHSETLPQKQRKPSHKINWSKYVSILSLWRCEPSPFMSV